MFHFANYAVPSWHHLQIQIGHWNGDILHNWNIRVQHFASAAAKKPWSRIVCKQHWDLFCYVAHLPEHRRVRRMLVWNPAVRTRQVGRPRHTWDQKVTAFCRSPANWDIGWTAHGMKKHGWHFLTPSTASAWPEVQRFVKIHL